MIPTYGILPLLAVQGGIMALPFDYVATKGDSCICGRRESKKHCPFCGSFQVRAYKAQHRRYNVDLGREEDYRIWTCDKCSTKFDETAFNRCEAPTYITKRGGLTSQEIRRTVRAIADGHPLTRREESIAKAVPASLIEKLTQQDEVDPNRPVNPISKEPIKGSKETYSEYLKRREEWVLTQQ
jgi:ribosomal protein L37AE/L43A